MKIVPVKTLDKIFHTLGQLPFNQIASLLAEISSEIQAANPPKTSKSDVEQAQRQAGQPPIDGQ